MRDSDLKSRGVRHISLAMKALMVFTALMLGQLLVSFLILQWVVAPAFVQLEDNHTRENLSRVRAALQSEADRLSVINQDWAYWDSTYQFARGDHPEFVAENLSNDVLDYLQLDWMCFVDQDQRPLWERFSDGDDGRARSSSALFHGSPDHQLLLQRANSLREVNTTGHILKTTDGPMLVTFKPILRNDGAGRSAGTVIVGRMLTTDFVQETADRLLVDFAIADSDAEFCPADQSCAFEPIESINGVQIGQFQIRTPATVTELGSRQVSIALQLLALTGLAYLLAVSAMTRRIILAPMRRLAEHIRLVTRTGDLTQRLHVEQSDEIGLVINDLNAMTNSLEQADTQVRHLAYNDPLTGLPNRRELDEKLRVALDGGRTGDAEAKIESLTLLFIDLDRFKRVNDLLSHEAGDELLIIAARRLQSCLRIAGEKGARPDIGQRLLARIGGDEFVVALYESLEPQHIRKIAKRIISQLEEPIVVRGETVNISASVGISSFPRDAADSKSLIRNADVAMYRAKEVGGGTFHLYNDDADSADKERVELARDLRYALEKNQLALYYQPQVDLRSHKLIGCEALIRWHHPDRGLVLPGEIISLAEEDGSIEHIGRWAIQQACSAAQQWRNDFNSDFKVSVNVSPRQLCRGNLVKDVLEALHSTELDPGGLILEVTESGVMRETDIVVKTLAALKKLGITIAMDDFGTGYSSLGYLRQLPIDLIKIDRMFIEELASDPKEDALVTAIISMADSLRRDVMAEGVETREQVELLTAKGCQYAQGYYFGTPCPADQFSQLLKRERRDRETTSTSSRQWRPGLITQLRNNHQ